MGAQMGARAAASHDAHDDDEGAGASASDAAAGARDDDEFEFDEFAERVDERSDDDEHDANDAADGGGGGAFRPCVAPRGLGGGAVYGVPDLTGSGTVSSFVCERRNAVIARPKGSSGSGRPARASRRAHTFSVDTGRPPRPWRHPPGGEASA